MGKVEALEVKGRGTMYISTILGTHTIPGVLYTTYLSQKLLSIREIIKIIILCILRIVNVLFLTLLEWN